MRIKTVLASKSPRRIEMLKNLGLNPIVCPANVDETTEEFGDSPQNAVLSLAKRKASAVSENFDEKTLVIAADTLVYKDKNLLGKPSDEDAAYKMLSSLSGADHSVYTGFAVVYGKKIVARAVETKVRFRNLSDEDILDYIATGEPADKAGGYGIQGHGSLLVEGIEGDYFNVVGLPLSALFETIKDSFGLTIKDLK